MIPRGRLTIRAVKTEVSLMYIVVLGLARYTPISLQSVQVALLHVVALVPVLLSEKIC